MTLNSYKIIPLTLTGILLAFSSQLCQACDGPPTAAELANATYTGMLSLDTLVGTEWVLTQMKRNEPLQEGAEVTLAFANDKISGKSACNRYSASVEQGEAPGDLKIGPAMGTRMACPGELMDVEHKYLDALSHVTGFSFLAGKLALSWEKEDSRLTMLFTPVSNGL